MRLWHYELIPVLPDKMLISQWRECIAIKRQWEKGTLKHRLVSYVKYYPKDLFFNYVLDIVNEMEKRNIKYNRAYLKEISLFSNNGNLSAYVEYSEHDNRYFTQCFYNLEEKYDRGIINESEWEKIYNLWVVRIQ